MKMDFNDAPEQKGFGELIPQGTKCRVNIKVRPGGHGEGGWLKLSKAGDKRMLDLEMTVVNGQYARRKIWELMTVEADAPESGTEEALNISRSRIRAILESARNIKPEDQSEAASTKRTMDNYGQLDGLEFATSIRIEKDKTGAYPDKNRLGNIITPEKKEYRDVMSGTEVPAEAAKTTAGQAKPAAAKASGGKPSWA